jgi:hypothetical protein
MYTTDTFQQALSFLVSQTTYIEPQVVRIKYPELNYADYVPIDTAANEWAKSVTFFSIDQVGQAGWFNANASDIPYADFQRNIHEQGIEMAAIGYRYNLEELAQAAMLPNTNLSIERAAAARRAYEEFCHNTAMYGDTRKNWTGLTNSALPAVINLTHTWAYYLGTGVNTPASMLQDFNSVITNIWQSSLTVEMADTILLPLSVMTLLSMVQLPNTTMNMMAWIQQNNLYTNETGRALLIRGVRGLDTAGASGNGRMIAYQRDPQVLKMHRPMSHRFLPVWQKGPIVFEVPGIFRLAGLEIRRPGAIRYADGVS